MGLLGILMSSLCEGMEASPDFLLEMDLCRINSSSWLHPDLLIGANQPVTGS